ncbi:MAG: alpha/beta hydrolase, partial [Acidobacteriota bacterium]
MRKTHKAAAPKIYFMLVLAIALIVASISLGQEPQILQPQAKLARVNAMKMYYEDYGQGVPLVLLHGFNGSSAVWKPLLPEFGKKYRLIVPDLRGHGRSNNPAGNFTHRRSALDVYALLDKLGIREFRGIGISTGGMTLIHMATQQPGRVKAMILVGATIYFPEEARAIMRRSTVESMTPEDWKWAREMHKLGDEQVRRLRR